MYVCMDTRSRQDWCDASTDPACIKAHSPSYLDSKESFNESQSKRPAFRFRKDLWADNILDITHHMN